MLLLLKFLYDVPADEQSCFSVSGSVFFRTKLESGQLDEFFFNCEEVFCLIGDEVVIGALSVTSFTLLNKILLEHCGLNLEEFISLGFDRGFGERIESCLSDTCSFLVYFDTSEESVSRSIVELGLLVSVEVERTGLDSSLSFISSVSFSHILSVSFSSSSEFLLPLPCKSDAEVVLGIRLVD